jgi:hypothetical protein
VPAFRVSGGPWVGSVARALRVSTRVYGGGFPPTPGETLAETTVPVSYEIRQD